MDPTTTHTIPPSGVFQTMMQVFIMNRSVEGRTKLYFSTTKTSDQVLAILEVKDVAQFVDLEAVIAQTDCFYPKKSIYKCEKTTEQKAKESLEQEAECAQLRVELAGFMEVPL
jgi:hypothetical protein